MIYSEAEANTKRCTPAIVLHLIERERFDGMKAAGTGELECIGSRCAQWRWRDAPPSANLAPGRPRRGYCGMAGRPELDS